jgi:hypothetical protein
MCVSNVGKPLVVTAAFTNMKRLTLKRNPVNALNVRTLSGVPITFESMKQLTLEINPACVSNVRSLC